MPGETTNTVTLIIDGVGESDLGMVTVLFHAKQARIEFCNALSILHQHYSCQLSVVVVRRYTNTPYILGGISCSLYLDMSALSGGDTSAQFPLYRVWLCQLLPFGDTEVLLPITLAGEGLKMYPHLLEFLWDSAEEDHHLSTPVSLSIILPAPISPLEVCIQTEGGLGSHPACTKREVGKAVILPVLRQKGWGITLPLSFCGKPIKPGLSWSVSSSRRHRNWLKNVSTSEPNRPGGTQIGGHRWPTKLMPLSKRCCPRWVQQRPLSCCPGAFPWWCPSTM